MQKNSYSAIHEAFPARKCFALEELNLSPHCGPLLLVVEIIGIHSIFHYSSIVPCVEVCNRIFQVLNGFQLIFGCILVNLKAFCLKICIMDGRLSPLGWKAANSIHQQLKLTPGVAEDPPPDMNKIKSNI